MPVVVAFGDSNTWGYDPALGMRFGATARWTGVMRAELGGRFEVIEEGLNGRTTVHDDAFEPHRNGLAYLPPCLLSHAPLDLVIIALGCNDLKHRFGLTPGDIARGAERLVMCALEMGVGPGGKPPKVLLSAPPPLVELSEFSDMFADGPQKSIALAPLYRAVAKAHGAEFIDAAAHIHCSPLDGIHYEADQHAILGRAMAAAVRTQLA